MGYVKRFAALRSFLSAYSVQRADGRKHHEYWIPAENLPAFNAATIGNVEVIASVDAKGAT